MIIHHASSLLWLILTAWTSAIILPVSSIGIAEGPDGDKGKDRSPEALLAKGDQYCAAREYNQTIAAYTHAIERMRAYGKRRSG